jgi:hypothetical protein
MLDIHINNKDHSNYLMNKLLYKIDRNLPLCFFVFLWNMIINHSNTNVILIIKSD